MSPIICMVAILAVVAFGAIGFWRGLSTKPTRRYRGEFIAGASDPIFTSRHTGQSDGTSGGGS